MLSRVGVEEHTRNRGLCECAATATTCATAQPHLRRNDAARHWDRNNNVGNPTTYVPQFSARTSMTVQNRGSGGQTDDIEREPTPFLGLRTLLQPNSRSTFKKPRHAWNGLAAIFSPSLSLLSPHSPVLFTAVQETRVLEFGYHRSEVLFRRSSSSGPPRPSSSKTSASLGCTFRQPVWRICFFGIAHVGVVAEGCAHEKYRAKISSSVSSAHGPKSLHMSELSH